MADSAVRWRTFIGDFLILGIGGLILLIFVVAVPPTRRGFFCEDESIRYPFKPSTIPNWALYIYGFSIPVSVYSTTFRSLMPILITGHCILAATCFSQSGLTFVFSRIGNNGCAFENPNLINMPYVFQEEVEVLSLASCVKIYNQIVITEILINRRVRASGLFICRPVPVWILGIYRSFVDFLFGCVCSQLITDVGKYTIGRLRPNFIDVCKPNLDLSNCSQHGHTYLTNYTCTNSETDASESRVSFPSGHSSFSAYTMLYIAIFVQVKVQVGRKTTLRLFKHGFQLGVILLSYFTALSRVMDNKHHWSDVLAGGLIGSVTAAIVSRYVSGLLKGTADFQREKSFEDLTEGKRGHQLNADIEASVPTGITREQSVTRQSSQT